MESEEWKVKRENEESPKKKSPQEKNPQEKFAQMKKKQYICSGNWKSMQYSIKEVFAPKFFQMLRNYSGKAFAQDALAGIIVG